MNGHQVQPPDHGLPVLLGEVRERPHDARGRHGVAVVRGDLEVRRAQLVLHEPPVRLGEREVAELLRGVPVKVNLIPMNPIVESALEAPAWDGVHAFCDRLRDRGVTATIRRQRGNDVDAACGQLALYGPDGERTEGRRKRLKVVAK